MSIDDWSDVEVTGDVFEDNVRCYVCPGCGFVFSAEHTDPDGGYTCPVCENERLVRELADRLYAEADVARLSPGHLHPRINLKTQAAALRFAADLVRGVEPHTRPDGR